MMRGVERRRFKLNRKPELELMPQDLPEII
jgi:hypothetical protein